METYKNMERYSVFGRAVNVLVHCILLGLLKNSGEHCFKNLFESQKTLLFI